MLIIWDYFGVVAQDAFWYTVERLADGKGSSELMQELHREVDLGLISWDEYCHAVSKDIGVPYEEVVERYQQHQIKQQTVMTILGLPQHTHVLLSNASHTYLLPIIERLGLGTLFSHVFVSSQLGFAKPDERAFKTVLQAMNTSPEDALMVDDSVRNIGAAAALGMKTILFHDPMKIGLEVTKLIS
jgi:HAD superfamily hydrolase (TIGR01509 family)